MKPSELFFFKETKNLAALLAASYKKIPAGKCDRCGVGWNDPPDDWLKTGWARDSQTHTRLVDSLICIKFSLENNAFSVPHSVMAALHDSMLHRFKIFSAPGTIAHGSIRLPPRSLESSRGCSLAIILFYIIFIVNYDKKDLIRSGIFPHLPRTFYIQLIPI